ncbi:MAG: DsbA family protein [Archangium sp.]
MIATWSGRAIRQSEVDAKVRDELTKLEDQIYELRSEAAERIAIEAIIADKAKAAKQSEDEWLSLNVEKGVPEPTDAQVESLYQKARSRIPAGMSFEDVKPQLRQAVMRELRAKRAREVFAQLKAEAGFKMLVSAPEKPRKPVDTNGPSIGPKDAKIVIVEFADFECPYCTRAGETVKEVMKAYEGKVRLVFKHYPLSFHPKAPRAAAAAWCAEAQGKFWEFHDSLFASSELDEDALKMQASNIGLDGTKFSKCLESQAAMEAVKKDLEAGKTAGVDGTPAFFINGIMLSGAQPEDAFRRVIDAELQRLQ